ncbi:MAG: hypothetical protein WCI75_08130 [candidate division NC10 bacterium]
MRNAVWGIIFGGLVVVLPGCSAKTQLAMEYTQKNGAHFSTWNHLGYSVSRGTPESTAKGDIELAQADRCLPNQTCKWWGEPVQVAPVQ